MNETLPDEAAIDIGTVARLARLALTDDERARFGRQLADILRYVATLDELDTDDVPPTSHVVPIPVPMRADEVGEPLARELALANAPATDGEAFVVPRVL